MTHSLFWPKRYQVQQWLIHIYLLNAPACQPRFFSIKDTPLPLVVLQISAVGFLLVMGGRLSREIDNLAHIMPVYLDHIPVKGSPFVRIRLKVHIIAVKTGH